MFINETGVIGQIFMYASTNLTGSLFLSLLGIIILIIAIFMLFRIPIEFIAILILPIMIVFMAYESQMLAITGAFILYMGFLTAKNIF